MYYVDDKDIVEKETGHVVETCLSNQIANELCITLNLGSGFQGWTPGFFCWSPKKRGAKIKS
jgi:hypothetical protein